MDIDRETVEELGVAALPVLLFIVLVVAVGTLFATDSQLSATGGMALVGVIVVFILVMAGFGYWLAYRD